MAYMNKAIYMLKKWVDWSTRDLYTCPDRLELVCYGSGYNTWGVQTHQKALAAYIIVATDQNIDFSDMKLSRDELLQYSLKMFRFMLESHMEGNYACLDGNKWGHTWISALGTERLMHAVEELLPYMDEADKSLMKKVMISEADWLLDYYEILADPVAISGKNKPESNIWNGAFLHRVAESYPDCPRANAYKNKGTAFLMNGISLPGDGLSDKMIDGKKVSQWHIGANFYDTYALDHHDYLNVGYMAICLSNLAMWHFTCKKLGYEVSQAVYHNAEGLWKLVKSFITEDGRLIRIGGDSRVRYCYCQDYVLPSLLFARDALNDKDAEKFEEQLVDLFYKEFTHNGDGSFLSDRCNGFREVSPTYYTRLESDKACVLSMLIQWNAIADKGNDSIGMFSSWDAPSHGACMVRNVNRFASWAFKGAEGMTGLALPPHKGDLAEWNNNLSAEIKGCGGVNVSVVRSSEEVMFDGGFFVCGEADRISRDFLAEGHQEEISAREHIVFTALPDGATTVVMQYAVAPRRVYLESVKGIHYNVPNDVYNDFSREYFFENESLKAGKFDGAQEIVDLEGRWVNIDNNIGIIAGYENETLKLYRPGKRQIMIRGNKIKLPYTASLCCDAICSKVKTNRHWADKGEVILNTAAVIVSGASAEETKRTAEFDASAIRIDSDMFIQKVVIPGADGKIYVVLSNPSETEQSVIIHTNQNVRNLLTDKLADKEFMLGAKGGGVYCIGN
jgi:hypothetical protein